MKHIKRFLICLLLIFAAAIFINAKTKFFKDIGKYIPYLAENHPYITEFFSEASDKVNEAVFSIPSPSEIIAHIRSTELPIDPDDIATNVYYSSDTMLNFYSGKNISVSVNGQELDVYGVSDSPLEQYLVFRFLSETDEVIEQFVTGTDANGQYRKIMKIPDGTYQFAVFTGPARFGEFSSYLYNYIFLSQDSGGGWSVIPSPVLEHNVTEYEKNKSISTALKSTYAVCSSDSSIIALANEITSGCASDYDKALALHDWVCANIYYDADSINGKYNNAPYVATDVLTKRRAVCLGYANLYASLCRAVSIPCNIVTGYALGVTADDAEGWTEASINTTESNHAWNEVYADNRWIIVDTTWDSKNRIENLEKQNSETVSHLYFDANIRFFSVNHKIIEYMRR